MDETVTYVEDPEKVRKLKTEIIEEKMRHEDELERVKKYSLLCIFLI